MNTVVLGAGITGRLAISMMPDAVALEAAASDNRETLTRNYGANYLWHPLDGHRCREFSILTLIDGQDPEPNAIVRYKRKVGRICTVGEAREMLDGQFKRDQMGYDLLDIPDDPTRIYYNCHVDGIDPNTRHVHMNDGARAIPYDRLVSTIPLPLLLRLLGWTQTPESVWGYRPIWVTKVPHETHSEHAKRADLIVGYDSLPENSYYRWSERDGGRSYEGMERMRAFAEMRKLVPGKIYPSPFRDAVLSELEKVGIFPFGRYATWTPGELVHETFAQMKEWADGLD